MKKLRLFIPFYFLLLISHAQESDLIKELENKLKKQVREDTNKVLAIDDLAWEYSYFDFNKSNAYCRKEIALSRTLNYAAGEANACSTMGNNFRGLRQFDSAHYYLNRALAIRKNQNRKDRISAVLHNIGNIYNSERKYAQAILTYNEAIK